METSLIQNSTDQSGKKLQKTVTYVNPAASDETLKSFSKGLNSLTTNTYSGTVKVTKTNLDDAQITVEKRTPTLTLTHRDDYYFGELNNEYALAGMTLEYHSYKIDYDGDGQLYVTMPESVGNMAWHTCGIAIVTDASAAARTFPVLEIVCSNFRERELTFVVEASETDTCEAALDGVTIEPN